MLHPARFSYERGWYESLHFHFLGFVAGGYGRCRGCTKNCWKCDGFEGVTRRENLKDGYIVRIFGKRGMAWKSFVLNGETVVLEGDKRNIAGTVAYQLSHAGFDVTAKRANVLRWFGVCSYRRLKVTVERRKRLCPICNEPFVHIRRLCDDGLPSDCRVYVVDMYDSDGNARYCEAFHVSDG